jgi:hypothetical protein
MATCMTCNQPLPEGQKPPGYFGHHPRDPIPAADNVREHSDEVSRLVTYTQAVFYALFCTWHYEKEAYGEMRYASVEPLTGLGQALCEEIDRRIGHLDRAGKLWQARAQACGQEGE